MRIVQLHVQCEKAKKSFFVNVAEDHDGGLRFGGDIWLAPNPLPQEQQAILKKIVYRDWPRMRDEQALIIRLDRWENYFAKSENEPEQEWRWPS
jgi:hypothetical protein